MNKKIIEENFPNLKKRVSIKLQGDTEHQIDRTQRNFPQHIIINALYIQSKERILTAVRGNTKSHIKKS